MVQREKDTEGK